MNIKGKVLFSLLLAVALLVSVIYGLVRVIMLRNVYEMEKRYMQVNIERVTGSVLDTLRGLSRTSADWASWDDTYKFVQNGNPDYIQNNMVDGTFQSLHLSFMIVVNTSGKIVFRKMFDLFNKKEIEFPVDIVKEIQPGSIFLHHGDPGDEHTGLFMTSEGPLMISSRPILTSNDEGPSEGSFLLGRLFDDNEINRIKEVTRLSFSIFPISRKDLPSDIKEIQSKLLSETETSLVIPSGEDQLSGYALLNDINGKPILIVRVDTPRDIHRQGQLAMDYAVVGLLITGLIFWVITLYILDKVVLSRLAHLNKSIRIIGIGRDLSARLIVKGKDELSGLSREMNTMLAELEQFQIHLRESELKLRTLFENALNPIWMLDQEGRFLEVNHSGLDFFESPAENLITRRFHEFLPPEIMNQTREISLPSGVSSVLERDFLINGRIKTILLNVLQINVGGEELEVYIGQDITDRKRAENDLASEKERLAVTLRSIGDGVIATDEEGNIRLFNTEAEILTGWTQDEVRGLPLKDIFRVVNEVTGNPCDNPVEATLKTGEMVELRDCAALITRDGSKRIISNRVSPIRNLNGRLIGVVLVFRDITEQHRLEEKIRRTASELTTIFQALPDLYFRLDAKGVVLDWRAGRIDDLYGADPQTFIGTRNVDYLPKEVGTAVQKVMDQVLSTGSLGVVEYALPFGETMKFFEARILPLLEDEIIMVVRNITEQQESKKKDINDWIGKIKDWRE
ncbi:MAG: CHASE4 domain-containing protein, partial [Atribacterota bacterium]